MWRKSKIYDAENVDIGMPSRFSIECPACGFGGKVTEAVIGKRATCPQCKTKFVVRPLQLASDREEPQSVEPSYAEQRIEEKSGEANREGWGREVAETGLLDQMSDATRLGLEKLGRYREYVLRQDHQLENSPSLFDWEDPNWYDVRGPLGTVAIVAEERGGSWVDKIRNLFGEAPKRKLFVLNNSMTELLLELDRSLSFLESKMEVKVATVDRRLGRVQRHIHPLFKTYELSDARGEVFAVVRAPIWRWRYSIRDPERRRELGVICKKLLRPLNEAPTLGDSFAIDFGNHDWKIEQRCILLAATVAIDLDSFEPQKVHWVSSG